jgi:hypothetical protein
MCSESHRVMRSRNRWSGRVIHMVPSSNIGARAGQLTRFAHVKRIATLCVFALCSACTRSDNRLSAQLAELVRDEHHELVDLGQLDGPDWQRACFLPPYTNSQGAAKILGFDWNSDSYTSIRESDGVAVLVLVKDGKVVRFVEHPRNLGDLSEVGADCLPRAEAKLVRARSADGWLRLVRSRGPAKSLERAHEE